MSNVRALRILVAMKSNKQRKAEIQAHRAKREAKAYVLKGGQARKEVAAGTAPCNPDLLAPYNSYGVPHFVERGYYCDVLFECCDCHKQEIWRATQQKWWYEVAKGNVESRANRCNSCRRTERERKAEARRVHQEGLLKKHALQHRL
jgi:nitrate reductase cytochrome c-type subunit